MLKKLIKYDLIWINKSMIVFFIISLIVSILTRIVSNFDDSFIGNILYMIFKGCTIACIASTIINCAIRIWTRFRLNIYKDESYLTHTLPVTRSTLYNSKILSSFISLLISLVAVLICILIVYLDKGMIDELKSIFSDNKQVTFIFINVLVITLLEIAYMVYCGIIGLQIGHKANNGKLFKSILVGVGLYFLIQSIIFAVVLAAGLLNSDMSGLFNNTMNANLNFETAVKSLVMIINSVYLIFISGMYILGNIIFKKGVNVE